MDTTVLFILAAGVFGLFGGYIIGSSTHDLSAADQQSLAYYESTYLKQSGAMDGYGSYQLISVDGGLTWYAATRTQDGRVTQLVPVEEKFPGLLGKIAGFDALSKYVQTHGPMNLHGKNALEEIHLLKNAGFTIGEKK